MKRTPLKRGTSQLKRTPLRRASLNKKLTVRTKKLKKDLMPNRVKSAIKKLVKLSHDYIRQRDGIENEVRGYCFDCGVYAEGKHFQCGHWERDSTGGALLRYHPHNMHGQSSGCNMSQRQEVVKIAYTLKMIDTYGREYVDKLRSMKNIQIKADILFYEKMIELYEVGNESEIVAYLHSLV